MFGNRIGLLIRKDFLCIATTAVLCATYLYLESSFINKLVVLVLSFFSISIFVQSKFSDYNFQRIFCLFLLSNSALYLMSFQYNYWFVLVFCLVVSALIWLSMFKINILRYSFAIIIFHTLLVLLFSIFNFAFYTRSAIITFLCLLIYQGFIWQTNLGKVRPGVVWQRTSVLFWLILVFTGMFLVSVYLQHSINQVGVAKSITKKI